MIEENLGLVRFAIARFVPTAAMEREHFFQEGVLGLAAAVDRYDPDRTGYFSAFALPHIRGAVISLVTTRGGDLRPSQARTAGRVDREVARREALGLPTRASEIARSLQMPERAVVATRAYGPPAGLTTADGQADLPDRSASGGGGEGLPSVQDVAHAPVGGAARTGGGGPRRGQTMAEMLPSSASALGGSAGSSTPAIVISDH